ncbi:hypothetical protein [Paludibaculum fermentans]|uniref:hypothetical protein n=1 Tax=Paludibaculum fermentans TaxID=1473598 RepID=UPI003EBCB9F0
MLFLDRKIPYILIVGCLRPLHFVTGELKIRAAIRELNEVLAAPPGAYDRFEIRLFSRNVGHIINLYNNPPHWQDERRRAALISEDMRHPKGIGCSPTCRHNRQA